MQRIGLMIKIIQFVLVFVFVMSSSALAEEEGSLVDQLNQKNSSEQVNNSTWYTDSMNFDYLEEDITKDDIIVNMMYRLIGEPISKILNSSFGVDLGVSTETSPTAVTKAIITLSNIVVILSTLYILIFLIITIFMQAKTADYLGGKNQPFLVPLRNVGAVALIQPIPFFGGLNFAQVLVTVLFILGLTVANFVAGNYIKMAFTDKLIKPEPIVSNTGLISDMFRFNACMALYNNESHNEDLMTISSEFSSSLVEEGPTKLTYKYGVHLPGDHKLKLSNDLSKACGSIHVDVSNFVGGITPLNDGLLPLIKEELDKINLQLNDVVERSTKAFLAALPNSTSGTVVDYVPKEIPDKITELKEQLEESLRNHVETATAERNTQEFDNIVADFDKGGMALLGYFYWRIVDRQSYLTASYYEIMDTSNYVRREASEKGILIEEGIFSPLFNFFTGTPAKTDIIDEFNLSINHTLTANIKDPLPNDVFHYLTSFEVMDWYSELFTNVFVTKNGLEIDPMITIRHQGNIILASYLLFHTTLASVQVSLTLLSATTETVPLVGGGLSAAWKGALKFVEAGMQKVGTILDLLFTAGLVMAVLIPLMPFIMFTIGVVGLLIYYVEAMAGISFMLLSMGSHEGNKVYGKAGASISIIFTLLFRPLLMVVGFILAVSLFRISADFMLTLLPGAFQISTDSGTSLGMGTMIGYPLISTGILLALAYKSFQLTYEFPNFVFKHLGIHSSGDIGEVDSKSLIVAMAAGSSAAGIGKAATPGTGKTTPNDGEEKKVAKLPKVTESKDNIQQERVTK